MNKLNAEWYGPFTIMGRSTYQYAHAGLPENRLPLPDTHKSLLGHVQDWSDGQGINWVARYGLVHCGGFSGRIEATKWLESRVREAILPSGSTEEPPASPKTIINDLLLVIYSQEAGWSDEIHRAVVRAIQRIAALVAANKPESTETTAGAVESHHSLTQFSGAVMWMDADSDMHTEALEIWLPQEPFGHISHQSLRALAEGVDVTILDLPTKDGIAVDSIIIEPRIKPIYGERDRKGFYVVPEGEGE